MNYKQFLMEMKNLNFIEKVDDVETVKELLKQHCKKMDFKKPFWRGMRDTGNYAVLDGGKVDRTSKHGNNLHTVMFGETFKGTNLPPRNKCIIAASYDGKEHAKEYGELYALFVYDEVDIGVVPEFDILFCIGDDDISVGVINDIFTNIFGLSGKIDNISQLMEQLNRYNSFDFDSLEYSTRKRQNIIDDVEKKINSLKNVDGKGLFNIMKHYYDPKYYGFEVDTQRKISDSVDFEIWFSGKCIAIKHDVWGKLKEDGFTL